MWSNRCMMSPSHINLYGFGPPMSPNHVRFYGLGPPTPHNHIKLYNLEGHRCHHYIIVWFGAHFATLGELLTPWLDNEPMRPGCVCCDLPDHGFDSFLPGSRGYEANRRILIVMWPGPGWVAPAQLLLLCAFSLRKGKSYGPEHARN